MPFINASNFEKAYKVAEIDELDEEQDQSCFLSSDSDQQHFIFNDNDTINIITNDE